MNDSWLLDQLLSVFYVGHDGDLYYSRSPTPISHSAEAHCFSGGRKRPPI